MIFFTEDVGIISIFFCPARTVEFITHVAGLSVACSETKETSPRPLASNTNTNHKKRKKFL